MKEIIVVIGVWFLSNVMAFVLSGGLKPQWQVEKEKYDALMNEIVARQPGGILSDFEAR